MQVQILSSVLRRTTTCTIKSVSVLSKETKQAATDKLRLHVADEAALHELVRMSEDVCERVRCSTEEDAVVTLALVLYSYGVTESPAFKAKAGA